MVWLSVTFALDGAVMADLIAALVVAVFLVKQQRVGAAFRNADAVIVAVPFFISRAGTSSAASVLSGWKMTG